MGGAIGGGVFRTRRRREEARSPSILPHGSRTTRVGRKWRQQQPRIKKNRTSQKPAPGVMLATVNLSSRRPMHFTPMVLKNQSKIGRAPRVPPNPTKMNRQMITGKPSSEAVVHDSAPPNGGQQCAARPQAQILCPLVASRRNTI